MSILETSLPNGRVRFATRADVPLLLEFISELAAFEKLASEAVATREGLLASMFGPRPYAEALIVELEGRPVGFALFFHSFSTFLGAPGLYLEDLFVRPEARGRGVGRALMSVLARLTLQRGCRRFEWSVLDWNSGALDFYRALGAVPMNEWTVQRLTGPALERLATSEKPFTSRQPRPSS